jgi:hypothetical protein
VYFLSSNKGVIKTWARIGVFCFPVNGRINPITALARRLQQRGHTV